MEIWRGICVYKFVWVFCICLLVLCVFMWGYVGNFSENPGFLQGFLGKLGGNLGWNWVFINLFVF